MKIFLHLIVYASLAYSINVYSLTFNSANPSDGPSTWGSACFANGSLDGTTDCGPTGYPSGVAGSLLFAGKTGGGGNVTGVVNDNGYWLTAINSAQTTVVSTRHIAALNYLTGSPTIYFSGMTVYQTSGTTQTVRIQTFSNTDAYSHTYGAANGNITSTTDYSVPNGVATVVPVSNIGIPGNGSIWVGFSSSIVFGVNTIQLSSSSTPTSPTVTTQAVTSISSTAATGNGNITNLGSANPTAHGVCYSTSANPTTSDTCTDEGAASSTGAFTSAISGLTAGQTYYVRAYATNSVGTAYGSDVTFTTSAISDPTAKADVIESSEITAISAINFTQTSVRLVNNRMSWLRNNATTLKTSRQGIKVSFTDPLVEQYVNGTQSGIKALAFDEASAATALTQLASNTDAASSSLKDKPVEVVMAEMKDIFGAVNLNPTAEPLLGDWSLWTEGQITVGKTDTQETDSYSLAVGVDRPYGDLGLIGVSLSLGQDDSDVGSSGSNVKSDNLSLSFYNAKELPNKLGLETQFGLGAMSIDTIRVDGAQTLTGKRDAKLLFGSVALRDEPLVYGDATLTPYGRAEWAYVELDPYDESGGSFALHYDKQHINRYMLILGSDVQYEAKYANGKLKPFAAFEYGLDLTRDSDVGMNYVSSSTSYTTKLEKAATSNLMLRLGADYLGKDDVRTSFAYERNEALGSGFSNTIKMQVNIPIK